MAEFVTVEVHNEFARRIDDENNRVSHRLSTLEESVRQITELVASVKVLATQMEAMATEQRKMGDRLDAIEEKPAKRWDTVISGVISGVVGILIGLISAGVIK
jgi:allophanate hydrolase subunit 1